MATTTVKTPCPAGAWTAVATAATTALLQGPPGSFRVAAQAAAPVDLTAGIVPPSGVLQLSGLGSTSVWVIPNGPTAVSIVAIAA